MMDRTDSSYVNFLKPDHLYYTILEDNIFFENYIDQRSGEFEF